MSLVLIADAQARVGASVTQAMIDGVEDDATDVIGPLFGPVTETFYLSERRNLGIVDGLWLSRRATSVQLDNDGVALVDGIDFRLINNLLVQHISTGASWGETLVAAYTPIDADKVKEMIYDLLTVRTINPNLQSVRVGAYSETYGTGASVAPVLTAIYAKVKPSVRLGRYSSPFRYRAFREDRTFIEAAGS